MANTVQFKWNGGRAVQRIKAGAREGASHAADIYIDTVKKLIRDTSKSGEVYRGIQASAPGEPPAVRTGRLLNGFKAQINNTTSGLSVRITNSAPYAAMLEYGTKKMAPRPFMRPALEKARPAIINAVAEAIRKAVK